MAAVAERSPLIDGMRCIAMLCVVLAHCEPEALLFQARNFDVPLLIVASAMTYALYSSSKIPSAIGFYKKRLPRLIIPAWLFLTFYFLLIGGATYALGREFPFSGESVIGNYLFYSGYVWILKVFLMIALLTPPLVTFNNKVASPVLYYGLLGGLYAVYEGAYALSFLEWKGGEVFAFFEKVGFVIVPYAILFGYGLRLNRMTDKAIWIVSAIALALCALTAGLLYKETGHLVQTQEFKYPPRLYYLSYAIFCINMVYLLVRGINGKGMIQGVMQWISENSLWIYLWHILVLYCWDFAFSKVNLDAIWIAKYFTVFIASCAIVLVQKKIVHFMLSHTEGRPREWIKMALT